jgi:outer membrane protein assembly factor BamB
MKNYLLIFFLFFLLFSCGKEEEQLPSKDGKLKWKFSTGSEIYYSPAIGDDGTIYVSSDSLYAVNPDGTRKWTFSTGDYILSAPSIGSDGAIYLVDKRKCYLYAINPDGTQRWKFFMAIRRDYSPIPNAGPVVAIGSYGTIYVGSNDVFLYAVDEYGTEKWHFDNGATISTAPTIGKDGTIYVGYGCNTLFAINPDGTRKWKFEPKASIYSSAVEDNNGVIYVGGGIGLTGCLRALYPEDIEETYAEREYNQRNGIVYMRNYTQPSIWEKWAFETEKKIFSSPAIGSDGVIYVGSEDNYLYAVNPNGNEKWKFKTEGCIYTCPAIGSDSTIYVGSDDNNLYAINYDGTEKWRFETIDRVESSPVIGSDGTIYVGSKDGNLYAIYSSSEGPADSPWPMFQHDAKHSGRIGGP